MTQDKDAGRKTPSYQESAKKFKPGPVAPPEKEHTKMAVAPEPTGPALKASAMSDGEPGKLVEKMPGEE